MLLRGHLHLDDELLARLGPGENIEHGPTVVYRWAKTLRFQERDIRYPIAGENTIEERDEYVLALLAAENSLEHIVVREIGVTAALRVNGFFHDKSV